MKRNIFILIFSSIAIIIAGVTCILAWYTNQYQTDPLITKTPGVVLSYYVGEDTTENVEEFRIKNLAFFDVDDDPEIDYFLRMSTMITINITNKTSREVELNISQVFATDEELGPHVKCLFTDMEFSVGGNTNVESFYTNHEQSTKTLAAFGDENGDDTTIVYVYVFGVQPDDTATNDFLSETYHFKISIYAC